MKLRLFDRLTPLLLLAVAGLGGGLWQETRSAPPVEVTAVATARPPLPPPKVAPPATPLSYYREVWERPLFNPDRRAAVVDASDPQLASAKLTFTLEGIMLTGDSRQVLVRSRTNQLQRLALGEQVNGWELVEVDALGARFGRGGKTVELLLKPLP